MPSFDGSLWAVWSDANSLEIYALQQKKLLPRELQLTGGGLVTDFAWCGPKALLCKVERKGLSVATTELVVAAVDPSSGFCVPAPLYQLQGAMQPTERAGSVLLLSEPDGTRVLTLTPNAAGPLVGGGHYTFIDEVPAAIADLNGWSKDVAAKAGCDLLQASKALERKDVSGYALFSNIGSLDSAVRVCIEAALHELSLPRQKELMLAANLGWVHTAQAELSAKLANEMRAALRSLRISTALRQVGIPLTFAPRLFDLAESSIVSRLLRRHEYQTARMLCADLHTKPSRVLVDWAMFCVAHAAGLPDERDTETVEKIQAKLSEFREVPFGDIARSAFQAKKLNLAIMLAEREPVYADRVKSFVFFSFLTQQLSIIPFLKQYILEKLANAGGAVALVRCGARCLAPRIGRYGCGFGVPVFGSRNAEG